MRLFGLEITRAKTAAVVQKGLVGDSSRGWFPLIREVFSGSWQRNEEWSLDTVLAHHAVYACVTLIATDVGKLRPTLVEQDDDGIWSEITNPAFSPVLRRPNTYQNHIQFKEWWVISKLIRGNTYAFKERDNRGGPSRGVVKRLHLLDPSRVQVMVGPEGDVFYDLGDDRLAGVKGSLSVPASEIIHDRMNCLFHPLVGISPIFANGLVATIGTNIEKNANNFFKNNSNPSGVITHPTFVKQEIIDRLREQWDELYSGERSGRVAVLTESMKFEPLRMTAADSQMIEHLQWTAEVICRTFHVPPFKLGIGQETAKASAETYNQIYYSDCLQSHIEQWEAAMDEGLGLEGTNKGVQLDLDDLLRMNQTEQIKSLGEGIKNALYDPNSARKKVNLKPLTGGDTVYMQQQNFSLEALNKRDQDDPFSKPEPVSEPDTVSEDELAELDAAV